MISNRLQIVLALAVAVAMVVCALAAPPTAGDQGDLTAGRGRNSQGSRTQGSAQASTRLMKELMETYKCDSYKKGVFQVELVDDNLYVWDVKLYFQDPKRGLYNDLAKLKEQGKQDHVLLRIEFSENYPNEVPFVRVVSPIFVDLDPGALCMFMLSPLGWLPDCTVEGLILSIMDQIGIMFRVDFEKIGSVYPRADAAEAQKKSIKFHRWDKPRPKDQAWYEDSY